jgi:hypothetical protein
LVSVRFWLWISWKLIKLQTCVKPKLFAKSLSSSGFEYHESLSNLCKT